MKNDGPDKVKQLLAFYSQKSREPKGGRFYRVFHKASFLGTYWGRDAKELRRHLNADLPERIVSDGFSITALANF